MNLDLPINDGYAAVTIRPPDGEIGTMFDGWSAKILVSVPMVTAIHGTVVDDEFEDGMYLSFRASQALLGKSYELILTDEDGAEHLFSRGHLTGPGVIPSEAYVATSTDGTPALAEYLKWSGGGNHPELIRIFAKAGALIKEDQPSTEKGGGGG